MTFMITLKSEYFGNIDDINSNEKKEFMKDLVIDIFSELLQTKFYPFNIFLETIEDTNDGLKIKLDL